MSTVAGKLHGAILSHWTRPLQAHCLKRKLSFVCIISLFRINFLIPATSMACSQRAQLISSHARVGMHVLVSHTVQSLTKKLILTLSKSIQIHLILEKLIDYISNAKSVEVLPKQ